MPEKSSYNQVTIFNIYLNTKQYKMENIIKNNLILQFSATLPYLIRL